MMGCFDVVGSLLLPKMSQGVKQGLVSYKGLASRLHGGSGSLYMLCALLVADKDASNLSQAVSR
jgi:hypothetical protein